MNGKSWWYPVDLRFNGENNFPVIIGKAFLQQVSDLNPKGRNAEAPYGDETAKRCSVQTEPSTDELEMNTEGIQYTLTPVWGLLLTAYSGKL